MEIPRVAVWTYNELVARRWLSFSAGVELVEGKVAD